MVVRICIPNLNAHGTEMRLEELPLRPAKCEYGVAYAEILAYLSTVQDIVEISFEALEETRAITVTFFLGETSKKLETLAKVCICSLFHLIAVQHKHFT